MNFDPLWICGAGFGGGLAGSMTGLASLITYPALLAVGLPPVSANVSNAVARIFSSAGSVLGSRPELAGQGARARPLCITAVLGGSAGGLLLLLTPAASFTLVVPWLVALASISLLIHRRPRHRTPAVEGAPRWKLATGIFGISLYAGYFGAAAGVALLTILLTGTDEPFARANAMKNLLLGAAGITAAGAYALFGPVQWPVVLPLTLGFLGGGALGPILVRRTPTGPLRIVIACLGLGLAVHLGLDAYR